MASALLVLVLAGQAPRVARAAIADADAWLRRAVTLAEAGRLVEADAWLAAALDALPAEAAVDPARVRIGAWLGAVRLRAGRLDAAEAALRQALQAARRSEGDLGGGIARVQAGLAEIARRRGRDDEATGWLETAHAALAAASSAEDVALRLEIADALGIDATMDAAVEPAPAPDRPHRRRRARGTCRREPRALAPTGRRAARATAGRERRVGCTPAPALRPAAVRRLRQGPGSARRARPSRPTSLARPPPDGRGGAGSDAVASSGRDD